MRKQATSLKKAGFHQDLFGFNFRTFLTLTQAHEENETRTANVTVWILTCQLLGFSQTRSEKKTHTANVVLLEEPGLADTDSAVTLCVQTDALVFR